MATDMRTVKIKKDTDSEDWFNKNFDNCGSFKVELGSMIDSDAKTECLGCGKLETIPEYTTFTVDTNSDNISDTISESVALDIRTYTQMNHCSKTVKYICMKCKNTVHSIVIMNDQTTYFTCTKPSCMVINTIKSLKA